MADPGVEIAPAAHEEQSEEEIMSSARSREEDEAAQSDDQDERKPFEKRDIQASGPYVSETLEETYEEVDNFTIKKHRPLLKMRITRMRRHFEPEYIQSSKEAVESGNYQEVKKPDLSTMETSRPLTRKILEIGLQGAHKMIDFSQQTKWNKKVNMNYQYNAEDFMAPKEEYLVYKVTTEGKNIKLEQTGGPGMKINTDKRLEDAAKVEETQADELEKFLEKVSNDVEEALQSNELIDVFLDDFEMLKGDLDLSSGGTLVTNLKDFRSYFDTKHDKGRKVDCIQFHPSDDKKIGVSLIENKDYKARMAGSGRTTEGIILIYDFKDSHQSAPIYELESPMEITSFVFHPKKENIIVAGGMNGQIMFFDMKGQTHTKLADIGKTRDRGQGTLIRYSYISDIKLSHCTFVSDIKFLPDCVTLKSNRKKLAIKNETGESRYFMSSADEGYIYIWEDENPKLDKKHPTMEQFLRPLYKMALINPDGGELGIKKLNFLPKVTSEFRAASDEGELLFLDWNPNKNKKEKEDNARTEYVQKTYDNEKNYRPCLQLMASPFYEDILLTIHDFHFCIWKVGMEKPIFNSSHTVDTHITCGGFSPTRPAVIFIGKTDGNIDIWDFLDQSHKSSMKFNVITASLTSMAFPQSASYKKGDNTRYLAVGDEYGTLHIFEIPPNLSTMRGQEEHNMKIFLDREIRRAEYMAQRTAFRKAQKLEVDAEKRQEEDLKQHESQRREEEKTNLRIEMEKEEEKYQELLLDFKVDFGFETKEAAELIKREQKANRNKY